MAFLLNYKRADRVSTIHVQNALAAAGHAPGPADGRFGLSTMKAVVAYQTKNKMLTTGDVNEALYNSILTGAAPEAPEAKPKKAAAKKPAAKAASKPAAAAKPAAKKPAAKTTSTKG